jgi:hypothetical protein
MKITNVYRQAGAPFDREQTPIGNGDREQEVWEECRAATMRDEGVLFIDTHQYAQEDFFEELDKGEYDRELVKILSLAPLTKTIHVPESGPKTYESLRNGNGKLVGAVIEVPAHPATTKEIEVKRYLDFCTKKHARHIASKVGSNSIVVIWEPYVEAGDLDYLSELPNDTHVVIFHRVCEKVGVVVEGEDVARKEDYTYSTLPEDEADDLIEHLLSKFALTLITAPSYTGKTHFAIQAGLSLITGEPFLGHFPIKEKVQVRYFVPELSAGRFKKFMERIAPPDVWKQHENDFIVRPLDCDLLMLDSAEMIEKCRGYYVFLDTLGYFTGVENESSYADAIAFATKVNHLIREGCLGVCGLYHPPKYSKSKKETGNILTIENQILGSAGYGGLLRSLLAMRNLHQDSNEGLWCYVQGLKNPGLGGPFQIKGVSPMELVKKPGESPYLSQLLSGNAEYIEACVLFEKNVAQRDIAKQLNLSLGKINKLHKKWETEKQGAVFDGDQLQGVSHE